MIVYKKRVKLYNFNGGTKMPTDIRQHIQQTAQNLADNEQSVKDFLEQFKTVNIDAICSEQFSLLDYFQSIIAALNNLSSSENKQLILATVKEQLEQLYGMQALEIKQAELLHINSKQHDEAEQILQKHPELLCTFYRFYLEKHDTLSELLNKHPKETVKLWSKASIVEKMINILIVLGDQQVVNEFMEQYQIYIFSPYY